MDATTQWKISSKVESLVDSIVECKKLLSEGIKKRYLGSRTLKLLYCNAHASPKLVEFLQISDLWKDHEETAAEVEMRRSARPHSQETVGDFGVFNVVRDAIIGDEAIRVVAEYATGEGNWETFFGTVYLVK